MGSRAVALLLAALAVLVAAVCGAGTASAHGGGPTDTVSVAQSLGARQLTVTLAPPSDGSGPMPVRISALGADPGGPLRVEAIPLAGTGAGRPVAAATVPVGPAARSATATLGIDRPGAWEIVVADGPDAGRIPLTVPETVVPAWVWAVRLGLGATVVLVLAAATLARRRPRVALGLGGGALVGATVVVTALVLPTALPAAPAPAAAPSAHDHSAMSGSAMSGMDMSGPGTAGTDVSASAPTAGHGSGAVVLTGAVGPGPAGPELRLSLSDGSTGAPVDDLVVHDEAFIHLVVVGPGSRLAHLHPVRTGPGRYTVRMPAAGPGGYGVFAEMERADGGHQVARSAVTLPADAGTAPTSAAPLPTTAPTATPGSGAREVAGLRVDVATAPAVVGRTGRVELEFSRNGQPVLDLQSWLGMAGHLMVLGPSAPGAAAPEPTDPAVSFAHAHDMTAPGGAGLGPRVGFSYAFPAPGRYQLWAQVQHDWQILTVPIVVDVAPAPGPATM